MTRRLLMITMAALCLGVTACAGFGIGAGNTVPAAALCPGKKPPANLTVVNYWQSWADPAGLQAAQDFNCAHPGIAVNISVNSTVGDDTNGKLLAAVAAHDPPDLVLSYDDVLTGWAARDEIEPLDAFASSDGIKSADYINAAWQSVQWKGRMFGVPVDWDPDAMLWYNKKVFADAGLNPDKPPTTWAQVQADAAKINLVQNGKIKRLGFVPWAGWQFDYIQLGHEFGATFDDGSGFGSTAAPKVIADSPGMLKVFKYEAQVAAKLGGAANVDSFLTPSGAQGAAADPLYSGRVGMNLIGDWEISTQAFVGKPSFRATIGVVAMPPPPGGQQYLSHSGWAFMVPTGAKHAAAAMQFVRWMEQSGNFAAHLGSVLGWLPARKATLSQSYITSDPTWEKIIAIQNQVGDDWWLTPSPILTQYYDTYDTAQDAALAGTASPAGALVSAQSQDEDALNNAIARNVYSG